jgi:hypothetical protein
MPSPEVTARHNEFWSREVDRLEELVRSLRNDIGTYNQVIEGLRSGELPWERVQIMETGQLKVHQPSQPIPDMCVEEATKEFGKRNGKKSVKEDENAVAELTEMTTDGN